MENFNIEDIAIQPFTHWYLDDVTDIHTQVLDGWSKAGLEGDIANDTTHSYVAVYKEKAVAFCSFLVVDDAELLFVCTNPDYRKLGIANKLLAESINLLPQGINSVILEVSSQNNAAIKLYEKMGFTTLGKRKKFYSFPEDDAIVMELVKGGVN